MNGKFGLLNELFDKLVSDEDELLEKERIQDEKNRIFLDKLNKKVEADRKKLDLTPEQMKEYDKTIEHYSNLLAERIDHDLLLKHQEIVDVYNSTGVNSLAKDEDK